ncbi:PAS domain-containing protein [Litorisediminicola beolgyonensis]|uniref:PAS domain-containing protein n=1 Tax=Litorisediminicola beolgyonensis TaxID=1173614 RepID=A0ABW3ZG16_9RHOB
MLDRSDQGHMPATPDQERLDALGLDAEPALVRRMEQSRDCIKLLQSDGTIEYMSHNGLCAMEIDDLSVVLGKVWWTLWPEEVRETLKQAVSAACTGRMANFVADCPTAKGHPRRWDVTVTGLVGARGAVEEILAVSTQTEDRARPLRVI